MPDLGLANFIVSCNINFSHIHKLANALIDSQIFKIRCAKLSLSLVYSVCSLLGNRSAQKKGFLCTCGFTSM